MEYIKEIDNVKKAVDILENCSEFTALIPEVRSNIVMAVKGADTVEQVVGIPGRITIVNGRPKSVMEPDFMSSSHMARLVISIMEHDPTIRSALNMKYDLKILEICKKLGLKISSYNRENEPEDVKEIEGSTIPWGVETAIDKIGTIPDIIYHLGAWGKEPMICLVGPNAVEVAEMAVCIAKLYDKLENIMGEPSTQEIELTDKCHDVIFSSCRGLWKAYKSDVTCIFCAIAEGNPHIEEKVLYNDKINMVLMNIFPYSRGHLEVVPVKHYTDINEIGSEEIKKLFCLVQRTISLVKEVIKPDGINIGLNLGKSAGASIEHIHIHIVPRFEFESGFMETTANTRIIDEDINVTYAKFIEKIDILRDNHEV
ncbi:MAG: thiamine-phosphate synthase family protein [Methanobacterium sp.]|uniref:thiamine-phosphate synthase family protein n=2 Tax=Methanobacterium sp. TaxID=2164 RepID=UPI003C76DE5E